jgi:GNAT superfamily N-acetyltransferase
MGPKLRVSTGAQASIAEAAALLRSVWPAPAIDYSEEYLKWQLGFGQAKDYAVEFRDDQGELNAFGAITPRRVYWQGEETELAIVSFVAVAEQSRGQGLAKQVYRELLGVNRKPVVTFAKVNSAGARLIEKAYSEAGYQLEPMCNCVGYAGMPARAKLPDGWQPVEAKELQQQTHGDGLIESWPDETERIHREKDPRGTPRSIAMQGKDGSISATLSTQSVRQANGEITNNLVIDEVRWEGLQEVALKALLAGCGEFAKVIQASNLSAFDPLAVQAAGWRQMGSGFHCWLGLPPGRKGMARAVNLSVV